MKRLITSLVILLLTVLGLLTPALANAQTNINTVAPTFVHKIEQQMAVFAIHKRVQHLVNIRFAFLRDVSSIHYVLTYKTSGVDEGVIGDLTVAGQSVIDQSIFLGTCSSKDCKSDRNITDINLFVTTHYKSGNVTIKTYHIH